MTLVLRTALFAPGNHRRRMEKGLSLPVDALILDLEDAVLSEEKEAARAEISSFLERREAAAAAGNAAAPERPWLCIRVNHWQTGWTDLDLDVAVRPGVDGVMLAKAETADDVRRLDAALTARELDRRLSPGSIRVVPLIESAAGVLAADAVAAASPRVLCLGFGGLDFVQDIGTNFTPGGEELLYARSRLVLASRAAGVAPPLDTVYPNVQDAAGLTREATRARQLGFGGKLIIHPDQIAPVVAAFAPTPAEIAHAREVLAAFEAARAAGSAVVKLPDGRFADRPVILWAERVLKSAGA